MSAVDAKTLIKRFCFLTNLEPVYLQSFAPVDVSTYYPKFKVIVSKLDDAGFIGCMGEVLRYGDILPRKDGVSFLFATYLASDVDMKMKLNVRKVLPASLRTADEFFLFCMYSRAIQQYLNRKGFSKTARKAIIGWYENRSPAELREMWQSHRGLHGFTHKNLIRMCRVNDDALGDMVVGNAFFKSCTELMKEDALKKEADIMGTSLIRTGPKKQEALKVVKSLNLVWEQIPCNLWTNALLVEAVLPRMTLMEIIKYWQLFKQYRHFDNPKVYLALVGATSKKNQQRSNIHPTVYLWKMDRLGIPIKELPETTVDALRSVHFQKMFYNSFGLTRTIGQRVYVAMTLQENYKKKFLTKFCKINYYQAAVTVAFSYFKREKYTDVFCFTDDKVRMMQIPLERGIQFSEALEACNAFSFKKSSQRLVQPLMDALVRKQVYDLFLIIVPSAGRSNPNQSSNLLAKFLDKYRETRNKKAKFVIVNLLKKKKSMFYSEERNENILEVCGLDPNTANLIDSFAAGRFG